jgi:hypothetical protein
MPSSPSSPTKATELTASICNIELPRSMPARLRRGGRFYLQPQPPNTGRAERT